MQARGPDQQQTTPVTALAAVTLAPSSGTAAATQHHGPWRVMAAPATPFLWQAMLPGRAVTSSSTVAQSLVGQIQASPSTAGVGRRTAPHVATGIPLVRSQQQGRRTGQPLPLAGMVAISRLPILNRRCRIAPICRPSQRSQQGQRRATAKTGTRHRQPVPVQGYLASHIQRQYPTGVTIPGQRPGILLQ